MSMPAESRSPSPASRTCEAHMPTSGRAAIAPASAANQPGRAAASSFSAATNGALDARMPWLIAAPKPTL